MPYSGSRMDLFPSFVRLFVLRILLGAHRYSSAYLQAFVAGLPYGHCALLVKYCCPCPVQCLQLAKQAFDNRFPLFAKAEIERETLRSPYCFPTELV
ncbi:hypothetical protein D3C85_878130 [compost metagenome]